jgi:hypothetical protein
MTRLRFCLFFVYLLLLVPVAAQSSVPPSGQWILPGQPVLIGEPFPMRLEIILPAGTELIDPGLPVIWGEYWLTSLAPIETTDMPDGMRQYRQQFRVTLWNVGAISTPPLFVSYRRIGETNVQTFQLPPGVVQVNSVLKPDDLNLRPLRPLLEMPYVSPLMLLGVLVLVAGAVYGLWHVLRRPYGRLANRVHATPARLALAELNQVARLDDPVRVHVRVAEVLRKFIAAQTGILVADLTTDELLQALPRTSIVESRRLELQQLLEYADLVKFAQLKPSTNQRIIGAARRWVNDVEGVDHA